MQIHPCLDRVLVKPNPPEDKTPGGIIIPQATKQELHEIVSGRVLAVGPGGRSPAGATLPMSVAKGDIILFEKYSGHELELGGEKLAMVREDHILAILSEG